MGWGLVGGIVGGIAAIIAAGFLWHPRTRGQRLGILGFIITLATLPPTAGSLVDAEQQRRAGIHSERDTEAREQAAREEMRAEFRKTREEMDGALRQIILAVNRFPPGRQRARAIQSALLDYDRAASRLTPESSTGAASLLPLVREGVAAPERRPSEARIVREPSPEEGLPDAATTMPATIPAAVTGSETSPVVPPPIFVPPPPATVIIPPPPVVISPR